MNENQNIEDTTGESTSDLNQPPIEGSTFNQSASPVLAELSTTDKQNQPAENAVNQNLIDQNAMEVLKHPHHVMHKKNGVNTCWNSSCYSWLCF